MRTSLRDRYNPIPMKRPISWRRWVAVFMLAMAIVHVITLYQDRRLMAAGYGDFSALYTAALMMQRGMGRQLYDPHEQWRVQQEFASTVKIRQGPMPYVRPPFEALLFLPLSYLSYPMALALWSALKLGCLFAAFWVLKRSGMFIAGFPPWLLLVLSLGFFPVFLDLYQGQDVLLLFLLVVLAFRSLSVQKDTAAGVFLGFGLFKFHLVLPLVILLSLLKHPRVLRGFVPVGIALVAISVWIGGSDVLKVYPTYLAELNQAAGVGMVTAQSMPNLRGLLTGWIGRAPYPGPIHWLLLPIAIMGFSLTVWTWRGARCVDQNRLAMGYSLGLAVTILTSYYAYSYDLVLLLFPLVVLARGFEDEPRRIPGGRTAIFGMALLLLSPLYWLLILHRDQPYLLAIPVLLLALGIGSILRSAGVPPDRALARIP